MSDMTLARYLPAAVRARLADEGAGWAGAAWALVALGAGVKVTAAAAGAAAGGLLASGDPSILLIAIAAGQLLGAATGGLLLIRPSASRSSTGAAPRSSS